MLPKPFFLPVFLGQNQVMTNFPAHTTARHALLNVPHLVHMSSSLWQLAYIIMLKNSLLCILHERLLNVLLQAVAIDSRKNCWAMLCTLQWVTQTVFTSRQLNKYGFSQQSCRAVYGTQKTSGLWLAVQKVAAQMVAGSHVQLSNTTVLKRDWTSSYSSAWPNWVKLIPHDWTQ